MPNPTVTELISRIRGLVRETTATYWTDTDAQMLGWATSGLEWQHMILRKALDRPEMNGRVKVIPPDPNHPYWRQFWKTSNVSIVADTVDYPLPATETDRFDVFHSLVDGTGRKMSPYQIEDELMIKRGGTLGVGRLGGFYTFLPGNTLRILTSPGASGTPKETQTAVLRYFRGITHHEAGGDTCDIRDEFTIGPVNYGAHQALLAKRIAAPGLFDAAMMAVKAIPGV